MALAMARKRAVLLRRRRKREHAGGLARLAAEARIVTSSLPDFAPP